MEPLRTKVKQRTSHDCGVACLAMAARVSYEEARRVFELHSIGLKRNKPLSSNFKEWRTAATSVGLATKMQRYRSWDDIQGPCVLKVKPFGVGSKSDWHWVFASCTPDIGRYIYDPSTDLCDIACFLETNIYVPFGMMIVCMRIMANG